MAGAAVLARSLKFVVEGATNVAFLPALAIVAGRGRHFEFFVGFFQLICSTLYNVSNALETPLGLAEYKWHELTNVLSITYALFLCIYLMANRNEKRDHLLRYSAFALVWVAQIKDDYWMDQTQYTLVVVAAYACLPVLKVVLLFRAPPYNRRPLVLGLVGVVVAAACFKLSLDDGRDPYRILHGMAQVAAAAAISQLWLAVPENHYKKHDDHPIRYQLPVLTT